MRYFSFRLYTPILFLILSTIIGCASIPPEIAQAHQKELDIIQSLQKSHLAMVDSFINERLDFFDEFYFNRYGPALMKNWKEEFKNQNGRDYNPEKDFSIFYSDLVIEYEESIEPIEKLRTDLNYSINTEYNNVILIHKTNDRWLKSIYSLQTQNKAVINNILNSISPGLSVDKIDEEINKAISLLNKKILDFI